MVGAPVRLSRVMQQSVRIGIFVVIAAFAFAPQGAAAAPSVTLTALLSAPILDVDRDAVGDASTITELRRYRHRASSRMIRVYRLARAARARIPLKRRVSRAQVELSRAQALGEQHCLATAIYHEARKESVKGQRAVAEVVLARTRVPGRPKSVCGVVYQGNWRVTGCQFSFTCDNLSDRIRPGREWSIAFKVAGNVLAQRGKRFARGATFYHASYVKPRWSKRMIRVARIGTHIFYRPRKGRWL